MWTSWATAIMPTSPDRPPLWWRILFEGLNVACALTDLALGERAASWLSDRGVALLVRIAP